MNKKLSYPRGIFERVSINRKFASNPQALYGEMKKENSTMGKDPSQDDL